MLDRPQYSYRHDHLVPKFCDNGPRTVMDAHCSLCSAGARWISRNDHECAFRIIPMQSALGISLLEHYGLDPDDPASWLFIEDGRAYESLDAVIRVAMRLGGLWHGARVLGLLPKPAQNFVYRMVAQNRYRIAGKTDLCTTQDPEIKKRLLM